MAVPMTDRLGALKQQYRPKSGYGEDEDYDRGSDAISRVLMTADETTRMIVTIRKKIGQVKDGHSTVLTSFNNQDAKHRNETLNEEIKTLSHKVHAQLKIMKSDVESGEKGPDRNNADFRIKKAQFSTLSRLFKEVMEQYNREQESYREKNKESIKKQLRYAGRSVTEEKLESILESDDPKVFTQDLILITAQKRQALGECETRHKEILQLEQNIRELHGMFYDMALIVDEQGELVDRIERNVENAGVYVYHGQTELRRAVSVQNTGRRTKCLICFLLLGCCLLLVIGGAVVGIVVYFQLR